MRNAAAISVITVRLASKLNKVIKAAIVAAMKPLIIGSVMIVMIVASIG